MKRPAFLPFAALLLPVLLGLIVMMGEWNRRLDRSAALVALASAQAIGGTPYSGARLLLSGPILQPRDVDEKVFRAGSDVLLRFRKSGDDWVFVETRAPGEGRWNASTLDVPARVERARYGGSAKAVPLVPKEFAIPESAVSRIRGGARLRLSLRRGALGNVWVHSAVQSADALGDVVALLDGPPGTPPVAVGSAMFLLDPREFATADGSGWMAPIADLKIASVAAVPGRPVGAVTLSDGRILVAATRGPSDRGIDLTVYGPDGKSTGEPRHLDGLLQALAADGSIWMEEGRRGSSGGRLVRRDLSGSRGAEGGLDTGEFVFGARDDIVGRRSGAMVARDRIDGGRLAETDRWPLDSVQGACLRSRDAIVASARGGVFLLKAGVRQPETLFVPQSGGASSVSCDEAGDVVVAVRLAESRRVYEPRAEWTEHLYYQPAVGAFVDLGEIRGEGGEGAQAILREPSPRMLVRNGILFYAVRGQIAVFDIAAKTLKARIDERAGGPSEKIL